MFIYNLRVDPKFSWWTTDYVFDENLKLTKQQMIFSAQLKCKVPCYPMIKGYYVVQNCEVKQIRYFTSSGPELMDVDIEMDKVIGKLTVEDLKQIKTN